MFELGLGGRNSLPIQTIAKYKNLIWNATGNSAAEAGAFLNQVIKFPNPNETSAGGAATPNLVALYMAAGGHAMLCGNQIMTMVINPEVFVGQGINLFPMIFRYELGGDQDGSYTGQGNNVGVVGIGENSFAYNECCLNVLDLTYSQNLNQIRRTGENQRCGVNLIRDRSRLRDGMRTALPKDLTSGGGFPQLDLRPEVSAPGRFYEITGLVVDLYNPPYFPELTACDGVTEFDPPRDCYQPIYGNGCTNTSSVVYNTDVAFWTSRFVNRVADVPGAVGARSVVWGFHPVYFKPDQVKEAIGIIVHDEWQLETN
jgi:hypothetical protein